nr:RNA-binding protein [Algoriphagus sp.]
NEDGFPDLVIAGEFMPITVLINQQGKTFSNQTDQYFKDNRSGWWTALHASDVDGDGDLDIIAGNFGNNSQFKVSEEKKLRLYASDFDQNGSIDPILECYIGEEAYPFASRDELLDQMVSMRSKFTNYESYADAKLQDLFSQKDLDAAQILEANSLSSFVFENTGTGFIAKKLPSLAQAFPIFQIQTGDFDQDGHIDLLLGGNQRQTRIRIGNIDAGLGLVLKGDGKGNFQTAYPFESGLAIKGDIKSVLPIEVAGKNFLLFGIHGQALELYQYHEK